ncbi:MAG: PIN domain-containing protein [Candidatus Hydrothermarchaeaceae archaeon]
MAVLETDFLIDLLKGRDYAVLKAKSLDASGESKYVTPVSATELLEGAHYTGEKYLTAALGLLSSVEILDFDLDACDTAGEIGATLAKEGKQIGIADTMIAGIVKRHKKRLLTKDEHYTRVKGLVIERY